MNALKGTKPNTLILGLIYTLFLSLSSCSGEPSSYSDNTLSENIIEPIVEEGEGGAGSDDDDGEASSTANLPEVSTGDRQFADPNVLVTLLGAAQAKGDAVITHTLWTQVKGPTTTIPDPESLNTQIVLPDVDEETQLLFQLTAQDSDGRVNASTTAVTIKTSDALASVVGGVVDDTIDNATFTVKLNSPLDYDLNILYSTIGGTAEAGLDYLAIENNSLVISAGETQAQINIQLLAGNVSAGLESILLSVTYTKDDGESLTTTGTLLIDNSTSDILPAPNLSDSPALNYVVDNSIEALVFENTGGNQILRCTSQTHLPEGLSLSIYNNGESCVLSGSPVSIQASTSYTVVATNPSGIGVVPINIAVLEQLSVPIVLTPESITLTLGQNLPAITISEGPNLTQCEAIDPLPTGLFFSLSEQGSCELYGIPSLATELTNYTLRVSNESGYSETSLTISVSSSLTAPQLTDLASQVFELDELITPLVFSNTGGGELSECTVSSPLPTGLTLSVASDNRHCEITGVPLSLGEQTSYTVTAINAAGNSEAEITIAVVSPITLLAPQLDSIESLTFTINEAIEAVIITNSGGLLDSCSAATTLPLGLSVSLNESDSNSCVISGTPTAVAASSSYQIHAENAEGSDTLNVNISIVTALAAPDLALPSNQSYGLNDAIAPLIFVNNGGVGLSACDSTPSLPTGLTLTTTSDNTSCQITGTPTLETTSSSYSITATNTAGNSTVALDIEVINSLLAPLLNDLPDQVLALNSLMQTIVFANIGGEEINTCSSEPSLPAGVLLSPSSENVSCQIYGTPTEISDDSSYTITASNDGGEASATVNIAVLETARIITEDSYIFAQNQDVEDIEFENLGGQYISACEAQSSLPLGLFIEVTESQTSCRLLGAITVPYVFDNYEIDVTNPAGTSTFTLHIESYTPPEYLLSAETSQLYFEIEANTTPDTLLLALASSEYSPLTECEVDPELPLGLDLQIVENECFLTGTPIEENETEDYTISASNLIGSVSGTLGITVTSAPVPETLTIDYDATTSVFISLALSSGTATVDWNDGSETETLSNQSILALGQDSSSLIYTPVEGYGSGTISITFSDSFDSVLGLYGFETPYVFDIADIQAMSNLQYLHFESGQVNGELSNISNFSQLETLIIAGDGTLNGELSDIPSSTSVISLTGDNMTLGGELSSFSENVQAFTVENNTLSGELTDISGNTALNTFYVYGTNTLSGNLSSIPDSVSSFEVTGNNTIEGSLSNLPSEMFRFTLTGSNTVSGDIADMPSIYSVAIEGNNTITGDIANISTATTILRVTGSNTLYGRIETLHPDMSVFYIDGQNTIAGDLGLLQRDLSFHYSIYGLNTINEFSSAATWNPSGPISLSLRLGGEQGFSEDDIDTLFIFLAEELSESATAANSLYDTIEIARINDAAPSETSSAARDNLLKYGYTVVTADGINERQAIEFERDEANIALPLSSTQFTNTIDSSTEFGVGELSYASSDPSIASVDASGAITVYSTGITTISASKEADIVFNESSTSYQLEIQDPVITTSGDVSIYQSGTQAFDGDLSSTWISEPNADEHWIQYNYAEGTCIGNYTIHPYYLSTTSAPRDFTLQGQASDLTWVTLDTRIGESDWVAGIPRYYDIAVAAQGDYLNYRLVVTDDNNDTADTIITISIGELNLFSCEEQIVIPSFADETQVF